MSEHSLNSRNPIVQNVYDTAVDLYTHSGILVITGATGTGKTHLAKALHTNAGRSESRFIEHSASSLSPQQFMSQLFGHRRGAFSDATRDFPGLVGLANHGTLCIDQLDLMAPEIQAGLLRFLQEKIYRPLGSEMDRIFTGKLILTSVESLANLKNQSILRDDFVFRLQAHEIILPELWQRPEDFNYFAKLFFNEIANECGFQTSLNPLDFETVKGRRMTGNLHELRGMILQYLLKGTLPEDYIQGKTPSFSHSLPATGSLKSDLNLLEKELILRAMEHVPENMDMLAKHLGISRRSLFYKLKEHGLNSNQ